MLPLEDQVCSLEHAKYFDEIGINKGSLFVYEYYSDEAYRVEYALISPTPHSLNKLKRYSAFTVAELGEMLPSIFNGSPLEILKGHDFGEIKPMYCARYYNAGIIGIPDHNIANACAKMLIHLIETKLITVEGINKCLA
jgi:hypothetical protein